ncbi:phiSA1p31-related protein [Streptomyces uncialis]|uniref:phiSA1p31-related protein n=1 Tax=Streptomyces uncialis TaxID=1048205 RepID=UPI00380CC5CE
MSATFKVGDTVRLFDSDSGEITHGPFRSTFGSYTGYVVRTSGGDEVLYRHDDLSAAPRFTVGDRVENPAVGIRGPIVAGPFVATADGETFWIVEQPNGRHSTPRESGLRKLTDPANEPSINVGDRVRVTDDAGGASNRFNGLVGTVKELHGEGSSLPFLVEFGNGRGEHGDLNGRWNCRTVELVDTVSVGDRVCVVKDDDVHRRGEFVGLVGEVTEIDPHHKLKYLVRFNGLDVIDEWWCEDVEPAPAFEPGAHVAVYDGETYLLGVDYRDRDGDLWRFGVVEGIALGNCGSERYDARTAFDAPLSEAVRLFGPLTKVQ